MAQQTAVEYLIEHLKEQIYRIDYKNRRIHISVSFEDFMTIKKESYKIEKEQVINAHNDGYESISGQAEQYYNETYGK